MKRCPECNTLFPDLNRFCDLDGTPLIDDQPEQPVDNWKILAVGAIVGLSLGVVIFVVYFGLTRPAANESSRSTASTSTAAVQPPPPLITPAEPEPSPSPSPEPSPSPTAQPAPSAQPSPSVKFSSSQISTTLTASTQVVIRLKNGAVIDADEAWEGKEGIWYRRGGVVALLDPAQVKVVERPTSSPSPSPPTQP